MPKVCFDKGYAFCEESSTFSERKLYPYSLTLLPCVGESRARQLAHPLLSTPVPIFSIQEKKAWIKNKPCPWDGAVRNIQGARRKSSVEELRGSKVS